MTTPSSMIGQTTSEGPLETLVDAFLAEQRQLTAVERFSQRVGDTGRPLLEPHYRALLPATPPGPGEQYAFEVDLDQCFQRPLGCRFPNHGGRCGHWSGGPSGDCRVLREELLQAP